MADCNRSAIPDSLILSKGRFKCDADYLPDDSPLQGFHDSLGTGFPAGVPNTFVMNNVSYNDEFMSWRSEVFQFEDSPVRQPLIVGGQIYADACNGFCLPGFPNWSPPCATGITYDAGFWTGEVLNDGLFGLTIQFYFNIYKKYCCTLDSKGNVIDYDYFYYFVFITLLDGVPMTGCNCGGPIRFCTTNPDDYMYLRINSCYFGVRIY